MLLQALKTRFYTELAALYPQSEVATFFYRTIEHYLGVQRFILAVQPQFTVTQEQEGLLLEALAQLRLEKPLQYVLGVAPFMDLDLKVNQHVLIPRPETEDLVQWVVDEVRGQEEGVERKELTVQRTARSGKSAEVEPRQLKGLRLLDVGTGSGCIAIALAKHLPQAQVYALDVSEQALEVARHNAALQGANVTFLHRDILAPEFDLEFELGFDLIVANPPYVREQEKAQIRNNVKQYEPARALFVPDDDPLLFYKAIARLATTHLRPGGTVYLEVNQHLATATQALLQAYNFSELVRRTDRFGNDRFVKGNLKTL